MENSNQEDTESAFEKLTDVEHVLKRPDSYVASLKASIVMMYVVMLRAVKDSIKLEEREISYIPALERIFLEILSNAADNAVRTKMEGKDPGKVKVKITDTSIEVYNEGIPVPTRWHSKFKEWIPSMIFFSLRAGSNFDDSKQRKWGGRNGYGSKLTAIFSNLFEVTCHNVQDGIQHFQRATDNMSNIEVPIRKEINNKNETSYTKVKFSPDFKRFYTGNVRDAHKSNAIKLSRDPRHCDLCWDANDGDKLAFFDIDTVEMFAALVFDFSFNNKITIEFQYESTHYDFSREVVFDGRDPMNYAKSFFDKLPPTPPIYFETEDGDNRMLFFDTPLNGFQRSFANALPTREGGVHVNAWLNALCAGLKLDLEKKAGVKKAKAGEKKKITVSKLTATQIAPHVTIFLSHYCINPGFSTQTKEKLTDPKVNAELPPKILKEFSNWNAYNQIAKSMEAKDKAKMHKALNTKKARFLNIDGMDDAGWAGTDKSDKTIGVVCEGKSAKIFFTEGMAFVSRERYGCLPIRGKILNVTKATTSELLNSKVIENLIKFFGLEPDVDYSDPKVRKGLRYGRALILTDADVDGIHIKTLLINFFSGFKNLVESGFVVARLTPVMVLTKNKLRLKFYSISQYEKWKSETADWGTYTAAYYKGLGSADINIIKESFTAPVEQKITCNEEDKEILELAMGSDTADERKELYRLLHDIGEANRMDSCKVASIQNVVFEELIQFAIASNRRAIVQFSDGLKLSYRQIIYTLLGVSKSQFQGINVLAGLVKTKTAYHHGEEAMEETLIGLAQKFPGSNNINFLDGDSVGFGTRLGGGKDHSAGRYLKAKPSPIMKHIFMPEDNVLLTPVFEDGKQICVETYFPIVPLQLLNRSKGVGWGWSSDSPNYHPEDIVEWIKAFIMHIKDGQKSRTFKSPTLLPWYRGYKGIIYRKKKGQIVSRGYFKMEGFICTVYDLPINVSGSKFEKQLNQFQTEGKIEGWKPTTIHTNRPSYVLYGCKVPFVKHKGWMMETVIADTQFTYLNDKMLPIHYVFGINEVLAQWCTWRYNAYVLRKRHYLAKLKEDARIMELRVKFVDDVIAEPPRFDIRNKGKQYIKQHFDTNGYPDEFLEMPYRTFSQEKIDELKRKLKELYEKIDLYERTHPGDLWIGDLNSLIRKLKDSYPGEWEKYPGYGTASMAMPD